MKKLLLFTLILVCFSCEKDRVFYEMHSDFEENRWMAGNSQRYAFEIENSDVYSIHLLFSYVYGFQFSSLPMTFTLTDAKGNKTEWQQKLQILNSKGKELGECAGDLCDLQQAVHTGNLSPGKYTISVSQQFPGDYIPNVLGLGISIYKNPKP